jgi:hypothetical protein
MAKVRALGDPQAASGSTRRMTVTQWEYLARNLEKVPGMAVENDFNQHGAEGWEFVATVKGGGKSDGYAIFKRPKQ